MSIPLKVATCAATVTLTLVPGVAEAAEEGRPALPGGSHGGKPHQQAGAGLKARTSMGRTLHNRQARATLNAQLLAALQRAARRHRARLEARWQQRADRAVGFAKSQRGKPYVWGGTGRRGYDCSGLVQRSWRRAGVSIPRVAAAQYRRIRTKVARSRLRPGDLVFFNHLGHVGMYVGHGRFIHSPRTGRHVTVERLRGYYRKRFVGARRPAWRPLPPIPTHLP